MAKQEKKLTGWYEASQKPARPGSYEREWAFRDQILNRDYWDGKNWYACGNGEVNTDKTDLCHVNKRWRGLARRPR